MQLTYPSERWLGGHGNRVGAKLTVEAQLVEAENTISVKQGTYTSLLSRLDGTLNRGLFWLHMHSIWSESKDPGTPSKVVPK